MGEAGGDKTRERQTRSNIVRQFYEGGSASGFFGSGQRRERVRVVDVHVASQAELMRDLFPLAKCVVWDVENNGAPKQIANRDRYASGFSRFLSREELDCMVRHAEAPQRVSILCFHLCLTLTQVPIAVSVCSSLPESRI